jgi:hypothetical protein
MAIRAFCAVSFLILGQLCAQESTVLPSAPTAANSDPNYRALRDGEPKEAISVRNLILKRDSATITLQSGEIAFERPVLGRRAIASFSGHGSFHLDPVLQLEQQHLLAATGAKTIDEDFDSALLVFSDNTYEEANAAGQAIEPGQAATQALEEMRKRLRKGGGENLEAEVLGELYNPARRGSFRLFMHGSKHSDLRFLINQAGAIPEISPEEVAVIEGDPQSDDAGIWYLTHLRDEWARQTASSSEDKRIVAAEHYQIETTIDKQEHLHASASVRLKTLANGDRVISFGLLPALRVSRAALDGKDISFIQEGRKQDGSFYVILPQPSVSNREYTLQVEYEGDKVLRNEGGGTFSVGARTSWYPSLNAFRDRTLYELTFRVPRQYTVVSVGKLEKEEREDDYEVTHWNSEVAIPVAGFNYGFFKKKERDDDTTHYRVEAYATREVPDYMRSMDRLLPGQRDGDAAQITAMSPSVLAQAAMVEASNAIRCYNIWFGETPFHRLAITQQPEFNFGQSWPTLVYLPVSAFLDATQRWSLMGESAFKFAGFIQEVTPHEVAHQWWGHTVGWASYRDQWLSEGFADFSAALYLEQVERDPNKAQKFWERAQHTILEKNQFGRSANDAGPVWMGFRLNTARNRGAYSRLIYSKGGYVLHMLRSLMWDAKTGDANFIAMMHDFVKQYENRNASTQDFEAIVEKHIDPTSGLEENGSLQWFFKEWIFGAEIPAYRLTYSLAPAAGGRTLLTGTITQSGVSGNFRMFVPVYLDYDGRLTRVGSAGLVGSSSQSIKVLLAKKPKRVVINAMHDVLASESVSEGS